MTEHKVAEVLNVTDEDLTRALNEHAAHGWALERVDYVREPGVRRPQMAFLYFTRAKQQTDE